MLSLAGIIRGFPLAPEIAHPACNQSQLASDGVSAPGGKVVIMIRFLRLVPGWLTILLTVLTAAAAIVVAALLPSHGWELGLKIALGAVFAGSAVGLPRLDQWQRQQEARLRVELEADPPSLAIPMWTDGQDVIDVRASEEETACLASLAPKPEPPKQSGRRELTPAEKLKLSGITREFEKFTATFTRPENRMQDQYREEVQRYLSDYREYLSEKLRRRYIESAGLLRVNLHNPTDRTFEDVLAEVYLPGEVEALDPSDEPEVQDYAPERPREFGTSQPLALFTPQLYAPSHMAAMLGRGAASRHGPVIDNSGSARIRYQPILLRPHATVPLDDVVLFVRERPGSVITGTWQATATNAQGRAEGTLEVRVAHTPLAVDELLAAHPEDE